MISMNFKNILRMAFVTAFLLLIPLVAMQFTDEVAWDGIDFIIAGILLFGTGLAYEIISGRVKRSGSHAYRFAVAVGLGTGLILIWMNLAVGLIGNEDNPANMLYGGVLAIGIIGAGLARLEPHGMARALFATAIAHSLVPLVAFLVWKPEISALEAVGVFAFNGIFALLFLGSGLLFRQAAKTDT